MKGRKRHIVVDSPGFVVGVLVTEANASERLGAVVVLHEARERLSRLEVVYVDQGYSGPNFARAVRQVCGDAVSVEVIKRSAKTFEVLPKRWIVERTFGWLIAQLMAALAEFERDLVRERVRSGLAAAKARGVTLGRRPGQRIKSDALSPKVIEMVEAAVPYRTIAHQLKISKTTVSDIVKRHRQAHPDFQLPHSRMASRKKSPSIYQLKITLKDIRPPIWRRVQVRSDATLSHLHWVIQLSMGWTNSHLHSFSIHGVDYGVPMPELGFAELEPEDERSVKLSSFIPGEKFKFAYLYDFGDSWEHEVLVEKVLTAEADVHYPVCIKAKRACPPEDCGGTRGYYDFVEAVEDIEHPEHEEMLEWVGGYYNPEDADFDEINPCLKMIPLDAADFEG